MTVTCPNCHVEHSGRHPRSNTPRKYCSPKCNHEANRIRSRDRYRAMTPEQRRETYR